MACATQNKGKRARGGCWLERGTGDGNGFRQRVVEEATLYKRRFWMEFLQR